MEWVGFVVWTYENIYSAFRVEGSFPCFPDVTSAVVEKISYAVFNTGNVHVSVLPLYVCDDDDVLSVSWPVLLLLLVWVGTEVLS